MDEIINSYSPSLAPERWEPIAAFVREAVRDCDGRTQYSPRQLLAMLSQYVDWCYRVCGVELERERIFRPGLIAEWAGTAVKGVARGTVGNYRTRGLRMQEVLNPRASRPRMAAIPPSKGEKPYDASQEHKIWAWAYALANPRNRRDAMVLVAGCLGAGLTGREVCDLRARDVVADDEGVVLNVTGARPREVPVLASVEQVFIDALTGLGSDDFVFRTGRAETHKNTASRFVEQYALAHTPVSTQRLRVTWVVGRLRAAVPIQALMKAMGVTDFSSIERILRHVPELDTSEYRARLRAEHGGTR